MKKNFKRFMMLRRINKIILWVFFFFVKSNSFSQEKNTFLDSISINIHWYKTEQVLYVSFVNNGDVSVVLPWKESLPYSEFGEEVIFNVYLVNKEKRQLLKITKRRPQFIFERNDMEIMKKDSITKIIELKNMISENEFREYEYIYVQYTLNNKIVTSNPLKINDFE